MTPQEIQERQIKIKSMFKNFNPELLEHLEHKFAGDCFHTDPVIMAQLNGQRQVILYLKKMIGE